MDTTGLDFDYSDMKYCEEHKCWYKIETGCELCQ